MFLVAHLLFLTTTAFADTSITCNYMLYETPTTTVVISFDEQGAPRTSASVTMGPGTPAHKESVTPVSVAAGETVHLWLSKENPNNAVEMIVFKEKQSQGNTVLINHNVPFAQEMWGDCANTP